ncbi:hypothetical protein K9K77_03365 [Candidatus Babeliales bacterium]|nr:hypothetical protein [Candidatus Babeliales bacterium]
MKKLILFLLFFSISSIFTIQDSVSPFEKAIIAFQAHQTYQQATLNNSTQTPRPPEVTSDDLLASIKETDDTSLKQTLNKYYFTLLGKDNRTGILFKLAYPENQMNTTLESQRLENSIYDIVLDHAWNDTTFTSTAPSVSLALKAHEVLEKKVRKEHETFLKYFTHVNKHTTKISCPLSPFTPALLQRTVFHYICIRIKHYYPQSDLPDIIFWS